MGLVLGLTSSMAIVATVWLSGESRDAGCWAFPRAARLPRAATMDDFMMNEKMNE